MKTRERLDKIIVDRGIAKSRERARALIMAGNILVDNRKITKAGMLVSTDADVVLKESDIPYVSRGGVKLEAALCAFHIDPSGKTVMDIGSSTGGFTDCVLKKGAARVYAVDVGYGQLDWSLRNDPRVVLHEKTNIRYFDRASVRDAVDLILIDVSFISLTQVLPRVHDFLAQDGDVIALVKPQFEVGREMVDKGGIVRDEAKRLSAVTKIREFAEAADMPVIGVCDSPIAGQKGNREYFIHIRRKDHGRA
ncbi:MAG TPA: TlyA family RNA methyltransferase [Thermodesulfovibrionales bacterium]|nr:TlyA family RNA methyltransferase [Thermodesulfovibrionales bacterium]